MDSYFYEKRKDMKNLIFISFFFVSALALGQKSIDDRAKEQTDAMKTQLNLTPEQYTKVLEINRGIIQKNTDIENSSYSAEVKREIIQSNRKARKAMLKDVLTAAQYEKLEEIVKVKREEARESEIKQ
ncbi:MAG: hypothetical protein RIQ90_592 [Bacteroidota bacterium]|jgi:hypothetical protein